jgi:transcriptional regulator with XRE-family HTH domain
MRERLIVARNLNSLDQKEAAAKLGYKNSSQLSKVESGDAPLPKSLLRKASLAYGVSSDWLLGLSNEPERDPQIAGQMAVMRAVHAGVLEHTQNVTAVMLRLASDQLPLESQLRLLLDATRRAAQSFEKVCRFNSTFNDDIRGGATLQHDIDEMIEVTVSVDQFLARRANLTEVRKPAASMPLFDDQQD